MPPIAEDPDIQHRYLDVMGWRIHCAVAGQGPPVLMVHGLGASWHWWLPTMRDLARDHTVYAIDLPGASESSPLQVPPTGEDQARLVSRVIEGLGLASAAVVAHSLGGYVALQATIRQVPGIRSLAVIAPGGVGVINHQLLRLMSAPLLGEAFQLRLSRVALRAFLKSFVYNPASVTEEVLAWSVTSLSKKTNRMQFLYQLRLAADVESIDEVLEEYGSPAASVPIQIYWGRHDPLFPVDYAYHLQERLSAPPPVILEHSGHIPQVEEAGAFNTALRGFLQGTAES